MKTTPHPPWAKHAMQVPATEATKTAMEAVCKAHAEQHCPAGMTYAMRWLGNAWEWYAPAKPPSISTLNAVSFFLWNLPTLLFAIFLYAVALPAVNALGHLFPRTVGPVVIPFCVWGMKWCDRKQKQVDKDLERLAK